MTGTSAAYSARAAEYADLLGSMTAVHLADRQLVDSWAGGLSGRVLDAGCGPGHWTAHLQRLGLDAYGIDLAPALVEHARSTYPGVRFELQSIDQIDEPDGSLGGVLSWFSTIHHEPSTISVPIAELARTLRPGGQLVLGYFDGDVCEPFDHAVVRAYRWPADELHRVLEAAGLEVVETRRRSARGERPVGAIVCERRPLP
ncbi:methyltransferase family protein [Sanguibacter keddieii DSM 10542]|uniref:Methyltransferase family protein n=1 Tax=Sanguibacter keddieii (strain ATCC 51767 / DSM 10542 / NCFB 3025 / ST-74) TaxID=446469 RepID=D1BI75_SANKS|nr:class I SAM-dependent methyltransferase [Sanguibacter keddieii]ACZ20049.1 methyltransferase family protein [Sanguibacter keddieii DSM 10542]